jgi:hypothetical protein
MPSDVSTCLVKDIVAISQVGKIKLGKCVASTEIAVEPESVVTLDMKMLSRLLELSQPSIEYMLARSEFNDKFVGPMIIRKKAVGELRTLQYVQDKVVWELTGEDEVATFFSRLYPVSFIVFGLSHFDLFYINKVFGKLENYENGEHTIDSWGLVYYKDEPKMSLMNLIHTSDNVQRQVDFTILANIDTIKTLYKVYRLFVTT